MGQVLHGCATTTEAIRRAIQHSQESLSCPEAIDWTSKLAFVELHAQPEDAARPHVKRIHPQRLCKPTSTPHPKPELSNEVTIQIERC